MRDIIYPGDIYIAGCLEGRGVESRAVLFARCVQHRARRARYASAYACLRRRLRRDETSGNAVQGSAARRYNGRQVREWGVGRGAATPIQPTLFELQKNIIGTPTAPRVYPIPEKGLIS